MEEMTLVERFDEIFWEVGHEHDCEEWYEIFDSELFDEVTEKIADEFGVSVIESEEFTEWVNEMAEDL